MDRHVFLNARQCGKTLARDLWLQEQQETAFPKWYPNYQLITGYFRETATEAREWQEAAKTGVASYDRAKASE